MIKKIIIASIALALILGVIGCGQELGVKPNEKLLTEPAFVTIGDGSSNVNVFPGDVRTFEATVKNAFGEVLKDQKVTWRINGDIGNISENGEFTALYFGTGTIEALAGSTTGSLTVRVGNSLIIEAYEAINEDFLYPERVPAKYNSLSGSSLEAALLADCGSVEGFVNSLGDKYTRYFAPGTDPTDSTLGGNSFGGIGVYIKGVENGIKILYVIPDGPAKNAGVREGDIIIEVDGTSVIGLKTDEAANMIRGAVGTSVSLKVLRGTSTLEFIIVRETISTKSVYSETKEGNIGYMRLIQFGYDSCYEFIAAYNALSAEVTGLIIDLRANGGGELNNALGIASKFVPESRTLMWYRDKSGMLEEYSSYSETKINLPVVLLVDDSSASASEVVTAALLDNGVATAVGIKTFGKGVIQTRKILSDNGHLYITCAEYLSPNKQQINGIGITPNIIVEITDADLISGNDPQLIAAINEVKTKQTACAFSIYRRSTLYEYSILKHTLSDVIDQIIGEGKL